MIKESPGDAEARESKPRRLNLVLNPKASRQLEELKELTESDSITEVVRRALATYHYLKELESESGRLIVRTKTGEREIVLL